MSSLVLVEARRGLARRLVRTLIAIAVLGVAVTGVLVFVNSEKRTAAEVVARRAEAARTRAVADCVSFQGRGSAAERQRQCETAVPPASAFAQDKRFHLVRLWSVEAEDSVYQVTSVFLTIGALIAGASFVGAEWRAGTVATLLTWEPRRLRVLMAKLVAAALVAFAIAILLQALMALALLPAAVWRGTTEGVDASWFGGVVAAVVRGSALASGAAVIGACIASIGRNTAAALGLAFGYALVAEQLIRALRPGWRPWLILENAAIFMTARPLEGEAVARSVVGAAVVLGAYAVAASAVAAADFARRDVG